MKLPKSSPCGAAFLATASLWLAGPAAAAVLLTSADQIIGGQYNGTTAFVQGALGGGAPDNAWPENEPPADLINGLFGGGGEKYLNFAGNNTGVIITPVAGSTIVTTITMWNANDTPARRPADYVLLGTNMAVADGGPGTNYPLADFTLISSGPTGLPDGNNTTTTPTGDPPYSAGLRSTVTFDNEDAYTSYMLYFPNTSGDGLFQLSEVSFEGTIIPEPDAALLLFIGLGAAGLRRRVRR